MGAEAGSASGPSEKALLPQELFGKLVDWGKGKGISEDDAEDLAQDAMTSGWYAYKNKSGDPKTLPSLIWHILIQQLVPQYFRGRSYKVRGLPIKKKELIDELSVKDQQAVSHEPADGAFDREALYRMMKSRLGKGKLGTFLDNLLAAIADTNKKQFIKKAASLAEISEDDARNRYRQIRKRIKGSPDLLKHLLDG